MIKYHAEKDLIRSEFECYDFYAENDQEALVAAKRWGHDRLSRGEYPNAVRIADLDAVYMNINDILKLNLSFEELLK